MTDKLDNSEPQPDDGLDIDLGISDVNHDEVSLNDNSLNQKIDQIDRRVESSSFEIVYDIDDNDSNNNSKYPMTGEEISTSTNHSAEEVEMASGPSPPSGNPPKSSNDEITWDDVDETTVSTSNQALQPTLIQHPPGSHSASPANVTESADINPEAPYLNGKKEGEPNGERDLDIDYDIQNTEHDEELHPEDGHDHDEYVDKDEETDTYHPDPYNPGSEQNTPEIIQINDDESSGADGEDYEVHESSSAVPEVDVVFAGDHYSLFSDPMDPDRPYILEDDMFQANPSELLDAFHDILGDTVPPGDELVIQVEDLCLEISPMMASTLQSMTISDFVHLHAKLVSNEESSENTPPLRLIIVSKPSFTYRYQELLAGANQGIGISHLRRPFDSGQGIVYKSPVDHGIDDQEWQHGENLDQSVEDDSEEGMHEDSRSVDHATPDVEYIGEVHHNEMEGEINEDEQSEVEIDQTREAGVSTNCIEEGHQSASNTAHYMEQQNYQQDDEHDEEEVEYHSYEEDDDQLSRSYEADDYPDDENAGQSPDDEADGVDAPISINSDEDEIPHPGPIPHRDTDMPVNGQAAAARNDVEEHATLVTASSAWHPHSQIPEQTERPQTASKTVHGDENRDEDVLTLDVGVPDEIGWEGDEEATTEPPVAHASANSNVNGKRELPLDELVEDNSDVKRRRSS